MALTDLTRISTSGIATGSTIDAPILRKDVNFHGSQVGVVSALFDSSDDALEFGDNVKLRFGASNDLTLFHNASDSVITHSAAGEGNLKILSGGAQSIECVKAGAVNITHNGSTKIETTSHGAVITGVLTATSFSGGISGDSIGNVYAASGISTFYDLRVSNNLTVEGTTTTLDTNLIGVDRVEVGANSNTVVGVAITQSGSADILNLFNASGEQVTVLSSGNVGLGSAIPELDLDVTRVASGDNVVKVENRASALSLIKYPNVNNADVKAGSDYGNFAVYTGGDSGSRKLRVEHGGNVLIENGNVGIGTVTPSKALHVDGTIFASGATTSLDGGLRIQPNNDGTNYGGAIYGGAHNDNNTAIYMRRGADGGNNTIDINSYGMFRVFTGGALASQTERFRIKNTGEIGIGTDNPSGLTHWVAPGDMNLYLKSKNSTGTIRWNYEDSGGTARANHAFVNYGNGKSDFFTWATHDGSSLAERVRITKEGKVGIGTDNPDALSSSANNLVIADFGGEGGMTIKTNVNSAGNIFFADADGSATGRIAYGHGATDAGDYMRFYVNSEERVRIRHDGKVGVGTNLSSSTYKFEVWDDTSATFMVRKGNTSRIVVSNDSQHNTLYSQTISGYDAREFAVIIGQSEAIRIGVNGGVGIGTNYLSGNTSVYHKLMVEGDTTSQIAVAKIVRRNSSASNGTYTLEVDSSSHTSNVANGGAMSVDVNSGRAFTINGYGRVGIGTNAPANILDIVGDAPVLSVEATNDSSGFRVDVTGQPSGQLFRIQKDGTTKLLIDQNDLITFFDKLTFNGSELYPAAGIGTNVGHRLNYRRNAPQSRTNTGSASQRYYKIGEIVLNGSESAEINIYGTQGYSNGTECAGKTTIVLRATNGNTLAGFWYEETLGNANLSDVRWKFSSGTTYELWVKASTYANIAPFVRCTGNGFTSFNEDTGSGDAPTGSTAVSTYHRKTVGGVATIRYNPTDTTFHHNVKMDSGKGIHFHNYDTGTDIDSNLLDDYEEGSWTPQMGGSDMSINHARYTKIGNFVHVDFDVINNSGGSHTSITNLPFTPVKYSAWHVAWISNNQGGALASSTQTGGLVQTDGSLSMRGAGGNTSVNIENNQRIIGSASYRV